MKLVDEISLEHPAADTTHLAVPGRLAWSPDGGALASIAGGRLEIHGAKHRPATRGGITVFASWAPHGDAVLVTTATGRTELVDLTGRSSAQHGEELSRADVAAWHPLSDLIFGAVARRDAHGTLSAWLGPVGKRTGTWSKEVRSKEPRSLDAPRVAAWSLDGSLVAVNSCEHTVLIFSVYGDFHSRLVGHEDIILDLDWTPDGMLLASTSADGTTRIWDVRRRELHFTLELDFGAIRSCSFSSDGRHFAGVETDGEVRLWRTDGWRLEEMASQSTQAVALAFHPSDPHRLAVLWSDRIAVYDTRAPARPAPVRVGAPVSTQYVNAAVLLLGDTGVGKSGLSLVLSGQRYEPTSSSHGRRISRLSAEEIEREDGVHEIREIFLWDLAGQPRYRLLHQLHLSHADVAIVVYDARDESDPLRGVRYWGQALVHSEQLDADEPRRLPRVLAAGRADRGTPPVSQARIDDLLRRFGFSAYFVTSAREGWGIEELRAAVMQSVDWDRRPRVASSALFLSIKGFLVAEKQSGRLLDTPANLLERYVAAAASNIEQEDDAVWRRLLRQAAGAQVKGAELLGEVAAAEGLSDERLLEVFERGAERVEAQGLVRRLRFGGYVLLQPELLDAYAAAIVFAAGAQPEELGSIAEDAVRAGDFPMSQDERVEAPEEEILLLATIEELLRSEIALREHTDDGPHLLFPSELTRDLEQAAGLPADSSLIAFGGASSRVYATLVVRLSRSGIFSRAKTWQDAAEFRSPRGHVCGVRLVRDDERPQIAVFFGPGAPEPVRAQFEQYVLVHMRRRARPGTVERRRVYVCGTCDTPLSERQVEARRARGHVDLSCPVCDQKVHMSDWLEEAPADDTITEMNQRADAERDRQANATVVDGKRVTSDFDVFLCHNATDKPEVRAVAEALVDRGLLPWLDEEQLRPGLPWQRALEQQIDRIKSAAVFVGASGIGPWQREELDAYLRLFCERGVPVIPVLLRDTVERPDLPLFLSSRTWVDFRDSDPDPVEQLVWGVTGQRPLR